MTIQKKSNALAIIIILLLAFLVFSSCTHWGWVYKNQSEVCKFCNQQLIDSGNVITTYIDTSITESQLMQENEDPEPFWLQMYLACDSNNQVYIKTLSRIDSIAKAFKPNYDYTFALNKGKLDLRVWQDSIKILHEQINILIKEKQEIMKIEPRIVIDGKGRDTWRKYFFISLAINILFILAIILTFKFLKK
jgi:hypothetical protein